MLSEEHHRRSTFERRPTCDQLVDDAGQAVLIGAPIDDVAVGLLGSHVGRRAHDDADLGEPRVPGCCRDCVRDTEIRQHWMAVGDEDVLGLDVAMDDALSMRIVEGARDAAHEVKHLG